MLSQKNSTKNKKLTLYYLLFGDQDIPVDTSVELTKETENVLIGIALILVAGAIITAKIVSDK